MFAFCFVKAAAAQLRSARKVRKTTRVVRFGMIGLTVLMAAAQVQAAGLGSNNKSGGSGPTMSSAPSFGSLTRVNSNTTRVDFNKPTFLGTLNQTTGQGSSSAGLGKVGTTDISKTPKSIDFGKVGTTDISRTPKTIDLGKGKMPIDSNLLGKNKGKGITVGETNGKKNGIPFVDGKPNEGKSKGKVDGKMFDKDHFKQFCHDKKWFHDYCHDCCFHDCYFCCPWWYCWEFYPIWIPLYHCGCGYWYDVPVVEIAEGVDLQLLAVRMIDSGDAAQNQGPAYRVWVRNNSHVAILHPFNVLALAAHDGRPAADLPQAGVRVDSIEAGQIIPVDIRLPAEANAPGLPMLHVLVDSHREIAEVYEDNNGTVLNRVDILPVGSTESGVSSVAVQ
jgi:hypothetical protein